MCEHKRRERQAARLKERKRESEKKRENERAREREKGYCSRIVEEIYLERRSVNLIENTE